MELCLSVCLPVYGLFVSVFFLCLYNLYQYCYHELYACCTDESATEMLKLEMKDAICKVDGTGDMKREYIPVQPQPQPTPMYQSPLQYIVHCSCSCLFCFNYMCTPSSSNRLGIL